MQSQFFTKDTLFNELPQTIKHKIMNIRSLSMQHKHTPTHKEDNSAVLNFFEHVSVPSSKSLHNKCLEIAKALEKMEDFDATDALKKEVTEFSEFVSFYRMEINNIDFLAELEKTIGLMENSFEKLKI
ncbi:hypothetical protein GINT2_001033 [Glugoides intestinalis]